MTAKIHRLTAAGPMLEPVATVIEMLRDLLARAEAGEIKGMGYFLVDGADNLSEEWRSGVASAHDMIAGVSRLHYRVMTAAVDG